MLHPMSDYSKYELWVVNVLGSIFIFHRFFLKRKRGITCHLMGNAYLFFYAPEGVGKLEYLQHNRPGGINMALTPSTMQEIGTSAPLFTLQDSEGEVYSLAQKKLDKGLLVIFMCNHCPYVLHILERLVDNIRYYQQDGIEVVAINSNDYSAYPDDSPEKMVALAEKLDFSFPYLLDDSQAVARAYRAACTPDLFLYDADKKLVYRGQFDSSRPKSTEPITGDDLSRAVSRLIHGEPIIEDQRPSMGCNIKWKEGNEPDYFSKG